MSRQQPLAGREDPQVVVEVAAVEHVAERRGAVRVRHAQLALRGSGAGVLTHRHAVVAVDQVADDVAEVVGEALVEGAGLAGVEQPGGGRGDAVGDLVRRDVGLDEGAAELLALQDARVAVDHLRLAQVAREHRVAVVLGPEVDRADQWSALVVPGVAAEGLVVVDDLVAVGLRGDGLRVGDRRARAADQLAGQPGLVLERRGVVGLDRAGAPPRRPRHRWWCRSARRGRRSGGRTP